MILRKVTRRGSAFFAVYLYKNLIAFCQIYTKRTASDGVYLHRSVCRKIKVNRESCLFDSSGVIRVLARVGEARETVNILPAARRLLRARIVFAVRRAYHELGIVLPDDYVRSVEMLALHNLRSDLIEIDVGMSGKFAL